MTRQKYASDDAVIQGAREPDHILVPVSASETMRDTVSYAVHEALETATSNDHSIVRFVFIEPSYTSSRDDSEDKEILGRTEIWAEEECGDQTDIIDIETDIIGEDTIISNPDDLATVIRQDSTAHSIGRIVLDPSYEPCIDAPLIRPLEAELSQHLSIECDVAPSTRTTSRSSSLGPAHPTSFLTTFGISFVFYQILAGSLSLFNIVTGAITSIITAITLSKLLFVNSPNQETPIKVARFLMYMPVLFAEIIKANTRVANVILQPEMPINPTIIRITPDVDGDLPLTVLANSITLTPGTLTARIDGRDLIIHTLDDIAREDLMEGGLERWVQYIFHGRKGDNQ